MADDTSETVIDAGKTAADKTENVADTVSDTVAPNVTKDDLPVPVVGSKTLEDIATILTDLPERVATAVAAAIPTPLGDVADAVADGVTLDSGPAASPWFQKNPFKRNN